MDLRRSTGVQFGGHNTQHLHLTGTPPTLHSTLPRDIADFTGRTGELARLLQSPKKRQTAVVTIHALHGMPGVGKTALAIRAAHLLAERYPDGHRFVRLNTHTRGTGAADPADVLADLLLSLSIARNSIPDTLEGRAGMWRDCLTGRSMLLVLDDAASTAQVEPLLPASSTSLVIVTSRRRLLDLDGARSLPLDTLPPRQAVELFTRIAGRVPTGAGRAPIDDAVRLCGYLPLAITLRAARIAHHPTWDVTDFINEFAAAHDRLSDLDTGDRAVAAAFDLSYEALPPAQQRLFRRLGLHPGPEIDAYAAAALDDIPFAAAHHALEGLYTVHLVDEPAPHRYRLHDLLRQYAHTLAHQDPEPDRARAVTRLLDYYRHAAQTADRHLLHVGPTLPLSPPASFAAPEMTTPERARAWLRTEHANLTAAAHYAAVRPLPHTTAIAHAMAAYLDQEGHWTEAVLLHQTALDTARALADAEGEALALHDLGRIQQLSGDFPGADALLQQALGLHHSLGNHRGQADALLSLGRIRRLTGHLTEAADLLQQALDLYHSLGDRHGQALALLSLGRTLRLTGHLTEATHMAQRALALCQVLGDCYGQGYALLSLGRAQQVTGDLAGAARTAQQAHDLYRSLGNRHGQATALIDLGRIQQLDGDLPGAAELIQRAHVLSHTFGNRHGQAYALLHLCRVQQATGDLAGAARTAQQAHDLYRSLGNRHGQATALQDLGQVQLQAGDITAADHSMERSRALFETLGDVRGSTRTPTSSGAEAQPSAPSPIERAEP